MIRLTINDQPIAAHPGQTLLLAAREHGIRVPTLCYHEALLPYGACRLCLVELVGPRGCRLVASCTYPCEDGLRVRTDSQAVLEARRAVVGLLLSTAGHLPLVRRLASELGAAAPRVSLAPDDCILCGLCVRACRELVGVGAISLANRGMDRRVATPFRVSSVDCIECATCVLICPTGAIRLEHIAHPRRSAHKWPSVYSRRACRLCEHDPPGPDFPDDYGELLGVSEAISNA